MIEGYKIQRAINKQVLASITDGDWVLAKLGNSSIHNSTPVLYQMWQVENVEHLDDFPFIQYEIKNKLVYTNTRVTEQFSHTPIINPLGIIEKLPSELVNHYINQYGFFKASKYPRQPLNTDI